MDRSRPCSVNWPFECCHSVGNWKERNGWICFRSDSDCWDNRSDRLLRFSSVDDFLSSFDSWNSQCRSIYSMRSSSVSSTSTHLRDCSSLVSCDADWSPRSFVDQHGWEYLLLVSITKTCSQRWAIPNKIRISGGGDGGEKNTCALEVPHNRTLDDDWSKNVWLVTLVDCAASNRGRRSMDLPIYRRTCCHRIFHPSSRATRSQPRSMLMTVPANHWRLEF